MSSADIMIFRRQQEHSFRSLRRQPQQVALWRVHLDRERPIDHPATGWDIPTFLATIGQARGATGHIARRVCSLSRSGDV